MKCIQKLLRYTPWQPINHLYFEKDFRHIIFHLFCANFCLHEGASTIERLQPLPLEAWEPIISQLAKITRDFSQDNLVD